MSRSEDLVIVRAELSDLSPEQRDELAAVMLANYRRNLWEMKTSERAIRDGHCDCPICEAGRYLDELGLL